MGIRGRKVVWLACELCPNLDLAVSAVWTLHGVHPSGRHFGMWTFFFFFLVGDHYKSSCLSKEYVNIQIRQTMLDSVHVNIIAKLLIVANSNLFSTQQKGKKKKTPGLNELIYHLNYSFFYFFVLLLGGCIWTHTLSPFKGGIWCLAKKKTFSFSSLSQFRWYFLTNLKFSS